MTEPLADDSRMLVLPWPQDGVTPDRRHKASEISAKISGGFGIQVASTDVAIRLDGLTRDFGSVRTVDGLSMAIPAGSIFGFGGPNGAGTTTTIRLLRGLLEPTRGRAEVLGSDTQTQAHEVRFRCGALLEHDGIYERLSTADNLEFWGRIWEMPERDRHQRTNELLAHFGLWEQRRRPAGRLSRGRQQKLAVARAVLPRPAVVFRDEPTTGRDPVAAAALREDLATLAQREGATIFLTTHNLAEAEKRCTHVGVIQAGRLWASGTLHELRAGRETQVRIVGSGFDNQVLAAVRAPRGGRRRGATGVSRSG